MTKATLIQWEEVIFRLGLLSRSWEEFTFFRYWHHGVAGPAFRGRRSSGKESMKHPRAYTGRRVWKNKAGWQAQVYVVAYVRNRDSRKAAVADLEALVSEMECGDPKCCGTHTVNRSTVVTATVRTTAER